MDRVLAPGMDRALAPGMDRVFPFKAGYELQPSVTDVADCKHQLKSARLIQPIVGVIQPLISTWRSGEIVCGVERASLSKRRLVEKQ